MEREKFFLAVPKYFQNIGSDNDQRKLKIGARQDLTVKLLRLMQLEVWEEGK
jgi:hypothetical protein